MSKFEKLILSCQGIFPLLERYIYMTIPRPHSSLRKFGQKRKIICS